MAFTVDAVRDEMRERVREVAALSPSDSRKQALDFAAQLLRMPVGKVKRLFYGEVRCVPAHGADQIRAYCEAAHKLIQARQDYDRYRASFLCDHPALARFAPGAIPGVEVPTHSEAEGE